MMKGVALTLQCFHHYLQSVGRDSNTKFGKLNFPSKMLHAKVINGFFAGFNPEIGIFVLYCYLEIFAFIFKAKKKRRQPNILFPAVTGKPMEIFQ